MRIGTQVRHYPSGSGGGHAGRSGPASRRRRMRGARQHPLARARWSWRWWPSWPPWAWSRPTPLRRRRRVRRPRPAYPCGVLLPWFPETENWSTHYTPTLGHYDSSDPTILADHVAMAQYAGLDAFIASWWGQGTRTAQRLPLL